MSKLGNKTAWHCCQCGKRIDVEQGYCQEHQEAINDLISQVAKVEIKPKWWPK
jgi:hypothetical protein